MLALLGLLTGLARLALIVSRAMPPLVALIVVPAAASLARGFGPALVLGPSGIELGEHHWNGTRGAFAS